MNNKILIISFIVIVAAIAFAIFYKPESSVSVTSEEEYLVEDALYTLTEEELEQITAELTEFEETVESEISSDMSMFYYT